MTMKTLIVMMVVSAGCGLFPQQHNQMAAQRRHAIQQAANSELAALVVPLCSDDVKQGGTGTVVREGIEHRCGSVWFDISAPKVSDDFLRSICGGVDDEKCGEAYSKMFMARMAERYTLADWSFVLRKCDAYPIECKNWGQVELWTLDSHNDAVFARARSAAEATDQSYREAHQRAIAAQQESNRRALLILAGALDGLSAPYRYQNQTRLNCTSSTFGNTTQTSCR